MADVILLSLAATFVNACAILDVTAFIELSLFDKDWIAPDIWVEIALSDAS